MTVTYIDSVATTSCGMSGFWRLLFRWRGSLYKLVWREFLVYALLYTALSLVYRLALEEEQKRVFERITLQVDQSTQLIPMTFVLGFYVSLVMSRWWSMYISMPWPDTVATFVSANITGKGDKERTMRRTLMRYVNLTNALTLIQISPTMKKRAPTLEYFVVMGLLTEEEEKILTKFESEDREPKLPIHWIPIQWATELTYRAREQELLKDDVSARVLADKLNLFKGSCGGLLGYDYINIPLVYTQVVTLAVYIFFFSTLMGRQFLDPSQNLPGNYFDTYVPVFTVMQFFFYMGWLKVAESLSNPFGEDDDDFDMSYLLDRNIKMSYMIVDSMHGTCPRESKDIHFDDVVPKVLFHTKASEPHGSRNGFKGSTYGLNVGRAPIQLTEQEVTDVIKALSSADEHPKSSSDVKEDSSEEPLKSENSGSLGDSKSSDDFKEVKLRIGSVKKQKDGEEEEEEKGEDRSRQQKEESHGHNALELEVDFADGGKRSQMIAPWFHVKPQSTKVDRNGRRSYSIEELRKRRTAYTKQ